MDEAKKIIDNINLFIQNSEQFTSLGVSINQLQKIMQKLDKSLLNEILNLLLNKRIIQKLLDKMQNQHIMKGKSEISSFILSTTSKFVFFVISNLSMDCFYQFIQEKEGNPELINYMKFLSKHTNSSIAISYSLNTLYLVLKELIKSGKDKKLILGNFTFFVSLLEILRKNNDLISKTLHFIYDIVKTDNFFEKVDNQDKINLNNNPIFFMISQFNQVFQNTDDDEIVYQCLKIIKYIEKTCKGSYIYIKEIDIFYIALKYKGKNKCQMQGLLGSILPDVVDMKEIVDIINSNDISQVEIKSNYLLLEIENCMRDIDKIKGDIIYLIYLVTNANKEKFLYKIIETNLGEHLIKIMLDETLLDSIVIKNNIEIYIFQLLCFLYNYYLNLMQKEANEFQEELCIEKIKSRNAIEKTLELMKKKKKSNSPFKKLNEENMIYYIKTILYLGFSNFMNNEDIIMLICTFIGSLQKNKINELIAENDKNSIEFIFKTLIENYCDKFQIYALLKEFKYSTIYKEEIKEELDFSEENYPLLIFRFSIYYDELNAVDSSMMEKFDKWCNEDNIENILFPEKKDIKKLKYFIFLIFAPIFNKCLIYKDITIKINPAISLFSFVGNLYEEQLKDLENDNILSLICNNILYVLSNNNYCSDILIEKEEMVEFINACLKIRKKELNDLIFPILDSVIKNISLLDLFITWGGLNYFISSLSEGFEQNEHIQNIINALSIFIKEHPKNEFIFLLPNLINNLQSININNNLGVYYYTLDFIHIIFNSFSNQIDKLYKIAEEGQLSSHLVNILSIISKQEGIFIFSNSKIEQKSIFLNKILSLLSLCQKQKCLKQTLNKKFFFFICNLLTFGYHNNLNICIQHICSILIIGLKSNQIGRSLYISEEFHNTINLIKKYILENKKFMQEDLLNIYELFEQIMRIESEEQYNKSKIITDTFLKEISVKYLLEDIADENKGKQKLNQAIKIKIIQSWNTILKDESELKDSATLAYQEDFKEDYSSILKGFLVLSEPIQLNIRKKTVVTKEVVISEEQNKKRGKSLKSHSRFRWYYFSQLIKLLRKKIKVIKIKASTLQDKEDELNDLSHHLNLISLILNSKHPLFFIENLIDSLFILNNKDVFSSKIQMKAYIILNSLFISSKDDFISIIKSKEERINFCLEQYIYIIKTSSIELSILGKSKALFFTNMIRELIIDQDFYIKHKNSLKLSNIIKALNFLSTENDIIINNLEILKDFLLLSPPEDDKTYEEIEEVLMNHIWKKNKNSATILYSLLSFIQSLLHNQQLMKQFMCNSAKKFYNFFKSTIIDFIFRNQNLTIIFSFLNSLTIYPEYIKNIIDTSTNELINFIKHNITNNNIMNDILDFLLTISNYPGNFIFFISQKGFNSYSVDLLSQFGLKNSSSNEKLTLKILQFQLKLGKEEINQHIFLKENYFGKILNVLSNNIDKTEIVQLLIEFILEIFELRFKDNFLQQDENINDLNEIIIFLITRSIINYNDKLLSKLCSLMQIICEITESLELNRSFLMILYSNIIGGLCKDIEIIKILLNSIFLNICLNKRILLTTSKPIIEILKKIGEIIKEKQIDIEIENLILGITDIIVSEKSDIWKELVEDIYAILVNFCESAIDFRTVESMERISVILVKLIQGKVKNLNIQRIFLIIIEFINQKINEEKKMKLLLENIKCLSSKIHIVNNEEIKENFANALFDLFMLCVRINNSPNYENIKIVVGSICNLCIENEHLANQFRNHETKFLYLEGQKFLEDEEYSKDKELIEGITELMNYISESNIFFFQNFKHKEIILEEIKSFLTTKQKIKINVDSKSLKCFFRVDKSLNNIYIINESNDIIRQISLDEIKDVKPGAEYFIKRSVFSANFHAHKCFSIIGNNNVGIINLKAKDENQRNNFVEYLNKVIEVKKD